MNVDEISECLWIKGSGCGVGRDKRERKRERDCERESGEIDRLIDKAE